MCPGTFNLWVLDVEIMPKFVHIFLLHLLCACICVLLTSWFVLEMPSIMILIDQTVHMVLSKANTIIWKLSKFKTEMCATGFELKLQVYQINTSYPSAHQYRASAIPWTSAGDMCLVFALLLFVSVTGSVCTFVLEALSDPGSSVLINSVICKRKRIPICERTPIHTPF